MRLAGGTDTHICRSGSIERSRRLQQEKTFTAEQNEWLGYIREHLVENLTIDLTDFEYAPGLREARGKGKGKQGV